MDRTLLFGVAILLFCVRDCVLIRLRPGILAAYLPALLLAGGASGLVAERLSAAQATAWLADGRVWIPAILAHAALSYASARRGRKRRPIDFVSVLPPPIVWVAAIGLCRWLLANFDVGTGLSVGVAVGAAYLVAVGLLGVSGRVRLANGREFRFAACTHFSAFLLIPAAAVLGSPISSQPIDWMATSIVMASVLSLLGLSFGWHRLRNR